MTPPRPARGGPPGPPGRGSKTPLCGYHRYPQGDPSGPLIWVCTQAPPNYADLSGPPPLICINAPWCMVIARVIYYGGGNVLIIYNYKIKYY